VPGCDWKLGFEGLHQRGGGIKISKLSMEERRLLLYK